jgi:glycosyltransferase involved in cell wall biosynthesis
LFVKQSLAWPRESGHDVHAFHMMQACASLGHEVSLATVVEPSAEAISGLPLAELIGLETVMNGGSEPLRLTRAQERFRSYFGIPVTRLKTLRAAAVRAKADAVIVVGLDGLPYFGALDHVVRVWYAADEWLWHHLSQLRLGDAAFGENVRYGVIKGLYERVYAPLVDRAWVVSDTERRAMRWLAGMRAVDVIPNGVDVEFFKAEADADEPETAVFWGRLDFGPNIQALEWFLNRVWPLVRKRVPTARFTIIGFRPSREIRSLHGLLVCPLLPTCRTSGPRSVGIKLSCYRSSPAAASRTNCSRRRPWVNRSYVHLARAVGSGQSTAHPWL